MSSIGNSFDLSHGIVLDLVRKAEATACERNQVKGMSISEETLQALSKEALLTKEKVQAAFNNALNTLDKSIGHMPDKSLFGARRFVKSVFEDVSGEYTQLQKRQDVLRKGELALSLLERPKVELMFLRADESELWHRAVERCMTRSQYPSDSDDASLKKISSEVDEDFTDPVVHFDVLEGISGDLEAHIWDGLLADTVKELNKIEDRRRLRSNNNCEEKS